MTRLVFRPASYAIAGIGMLVKSIGLAIGPIAFTVAFAASAGFSLAWLLTLALALPPLLVEASDVPRTSAGIFTVSYAIAVLTALATKVMVTDGPNRFIGALPIAFAAFVVIVIGVTIRPARGPAVFEMLTLMT